MPLWPGVFQFNVVLRKLMCISAFGPSSSPSNSLVLLLIHLAFLLCSLGRHILAQNSLVSLTSGCWYVFVSSPRLVGKISFRCFGMSCFACIVLPFVDVCLIFLLSPVLSDLFLHVVLLFFLVLPFLFCPYMWQRFSFVFSFWPVSVDFFYLRFQSNFPSKFWFFSLRGS